MNNKRGVTMVTVSARALKHAFRKALPEKTAIELTPLWERFWAGIVLSAKVEQVKPENHYDPSLPFGGRENEPPVTDDK